MSYDSKADTLEHIKYVNKHLIFFAQALLSRAIVHDNSKLESPEKEEFDRLTPKLKELTYGSPEYKESLKELGTALEHHYENNSHHPEHYPNGIEGMDLLDLVEMYCDWKAAVLRTQGGDMGKSIDFNEGRFNMAGQLADIFRNTAERYAMDKHLR